MGWEMSYPYLEEMSDEKLRAFDLRLYNQYDAAAIKDRIRKILRRRSHEQLLRGRAGH